MSEGFSVLKMKHIPETGQTSIEVNGNLPLATVYLLLDVWQKMFLEGKVIPNGQPIQTAAVPQFSRPAPKA